MIDTGFATRNNNDHVLSFDGKSSGISHGSPEDNGRSIVYTLPVTAARRNASQPTRAVVFARILAGRQIRALHRRARQRARHLQDPRDGGDEVRLTDAKGVDDGSEYTPDGKWIYFNSSRTGRMQIWRMRPDGSEQEQITKDDELQRLVPARLARRQVNRVHLVPPRRRARTNIRSTSTSTCAR